MKKRTSLSILILVFCLMLFSFPSFISAHAYIVKSSPNSNETLKQSPAKASIQFDETIQAVNNSIQVYDTNGNRVDQKNGRIDPKNSSILECGLNRSLPNGTYRIQWKVVSSDGHPVQGVIPFQIGPGKTQNEPLTIQKTKGYTPHLDLIVIRWIQYFSNAIYVGMLFFFLFVIPNELVYNPFVKKTISNLIRISFLLLLLSILFSLPLMATIELTTSWSSVFNIQTLKEMITNTAFGSIWVIQVYGLILLAIFTYLIHAKRFSKNLIVWISFIIGIALLLTKAFTSHAASSTNRALMISLDFLHLVSASIWIGSLVALAVFIPLSRKMDTKNQYMDMIRRFSKWGIMIILVLSATGIFESFSYIPNLRSLVFTDYGRVLTGKAILLCIMVIFAAMNFFKGRRNNEKNLSSSLWGELITGMIVLILSVLLTNLPTAMSSPGPVNIIKSVEHGRSISLHVTPNTIGENTFEVYLKDKNGKALSNIQQVTLTFKSLEMDMGEDTITLSEVKEGYYLAKGMDFNMSGHWNVHVHALTKDLNTIDTDIPCIVGSQ
ncbi:MAG: copper resistance protein CopC [Bacillota bacterium]|nr:copper resistance protein CopC [Bacillota bacterium]